MVFRPSKYQVFLTTVVIFTLGLLIFQNVIFPPPKGNPVKIGIVDSGCTLGQRSSVTEFKAFTLKKYGYSYDENGIYDTYGHGRLVCNIIIDGTHDVDIYSAKIANGNGEVTYDGLFAAINYLVKDVDVDIINLSLGGEPYVSSDLLSAFEEFATTKVFIAAIGNKGNDFNNPEGVIDWPASLPWVVGIGALNDSNQFAAYSSYGRDSSGLYTTEFVEKGTEGSTAGTSFSTPRITVDYANLWNQLLSEGEEVSPQKLSYLLSQSTGQENFDNRIGWGVPHASNIGRKQGVAILGPKIENDRYTRFLSENWTMEWKIYATIPLDSMDITTNSSANVISSILENYDWGNLLRINFRGNQSGKFEVNISHSLGNNITYEYNVIDHQPDHRILLDHRNTINGFAHSYGQYSRIEQYLRSHGVLVDQIQTGGIELDIYDAVLVTEFGRQISLDRKFAREFNTTLIQNYANYVEKGGKLQISLTIPDQLNTQEYGSTVNRFGADITSYKIPNTDENIAYTSNLTKTTLLDGVIAMGTSGSAISAVNASQTVLGYYRAVAHESGEVTRDLQIGIATTLGTGNIVIWAGSFMMKNDYFRDQGYNYDRFLLNYIAYE